MTNPAALTLEHPLDIDDARRASRRLAELRRSAEDTLEGLTRTAAEAELAYRQARGVAWVTAPEGTAKLREDWVNDQTAPVRYERDLHAGMVKVQVERLRGLEGERSMLKSLLDWSMRLGVDGRETYPKAGM